MALALADSLIACGDLDPKDLGERFVNSWKEGAYARTGACFDIGNLNRSALERFRRTADVAAGSTDENSAGNGSLMRLSPVVLHALHDPERLARIAAAQSRVTHGAPQAVEACLCYVRRQAPPRHPRRVQSRTPDAPAMRHPTALRAVRRQSEEQGKIGDPVERLRDRHARSEPCGRSSGPTTSKTRSCWRSISPTTPTPWAP